MEKTEYCYQCGVSLPENAERCPVCGEPCDGSLAGKNSISLQGLSFRFRVLCFLVPIFGFLWAALHLKSDSFRAKRAASVSYGGLLLQSALLLFVFAVWRVVSFP